MGLHTFPAKNQTIEQQQQDEIACYAWAKQDSGFDPLGALTGQQQAPASASAQRSNPQTGGPGAEAKGALGGAAGGAATGAVIGAITGNAGKGAAAGAAGGGLLGGLMTKRAQMEEQKQAQQQQLLQAQQQARAKAQLQQQLEGFKKGFSACMEAKNYVVK